MLVNNAGVGFGAPVAEIVTKRLDMQLDLNLRSIVLFYRECADMLKAAGAEHRNALVVNTASIAGKSGQAWLSVYSATKAGVIGYTQAMNRELANDGIKSVALCPGFVDTADDRVRPRAGQGGGHDPDHRHLRERAVPATSLPDCVVPEIVFQRPDEQV